MKFADIEKMISVKGMVIRCSSIIPEIKEAVFQCLICGYYSEPITVARGKISTLINLHLFKIPCEWNSNLVPFVLFLGHISEPNCCPRGECKAVNSMTLIHNRCR